MSVSRRSNDEIEIGIAAQSDHKNRDYVIQFFRERGHMSSPIKECIDGRFWIRYQW